MDLGLTEEQLLLQRTVREFAESEVKPLAKELDETGHFPRDIFRKAAELGLTGVAVPEAIRRRWHGSRQLRDRHRGDFARLRVHGRDSFRPEFALLRSRFSLRNRRAKAKTSCSLRARRKNRLLCAHRTSSRLQRCRTCAPRRCSKATSTSSTAPKPGSPTAAPRTRRLCTRTRIRKKARRESPR